jgi:high-affinity nickel permease
MSLEFYTSLGKLGLFILAALAIIVLINLIGAFIQRLRDPRLEAQAIADFVASRGYSYKVTGRIREDDYDLRGTYP